MDGATQLTIGQLAEHFVNHSRGAIDISSEALKLVRAEVAVHHHFRAAIDGGKGIAEVVHDGTRKLSDGGNALTANELFARALDGAGHRVERTGKATEFVIALARLLDRDAGRSRGGQADVPAPAPLIDVM